MCLHRHLADSEDTCPACLDRIAQTRHEIRQILDDVEQAYLAAVVRGVGSVAFMVNAPAANYEAHSYLHHSATSGRLCKCRRRGHPCPSDLPAVHGPVHQNRNPAAGRCTHPSCNAIRAPRVCPDAAFIFDQGSMADRHPLTVLSDWELTWRRILGHEEDDHPTLASTSTYLLKNLGYMARHPDGEFTEFTKAISSELTWLQEVLRTGDRPDRGAPCPACGKAKLEKDWSDVGKPAGYQPGNEHRRYPDIWYCPRDECGQTWTESEYHHRVEGIYIQTADHLTASQLSRLLDVPESTIRRWASGPTQTVATHGRDHNGRQLYSVDDARAARDRKVPRQEATP